MRPTQPRADFWLRQPPSRERDPGPVSRNVMNANIAVTAIPAARAAEDASGRAGGGRELGFLLPREGDPGQGVVAETQRPLFLAILARADGRPQQARELSGVLRAEQVGEGDTFEFAAIIFWSVSFPETRAVVSVPSTLAEGQVGHQPLEGLPSPVSLRGEPIGPFVQEPGAGWGRAGTIAVICASTVAPATRAHAEPPRAARSSCVTTTRAEGSELRD